MPLARPAAAAPGRWPTSPPRPPLPAVLAEGPAGFLPADKVSIDIVIIWLTGNAVFPGIFARFGLMASAGLWYTGVLFGADGALKEMGRASVVTPPRPVAPSWLGA